MQSKMYVSILLALLAFSLYAPGRERGSERSGSVTWPFQSYANVIVVKTDADWWVFDTGASYTAVSTPGGAILTIGSVDINAVPAQEHLAVACKEIGKALHVKVRGALGQDVMRGFDRVIIDYRTQTVTLERKER